MAKTASGHEHCSLVQYCSCVQWFVWSHMVISSIFNPIFAIPTPHPNRLRAFKRVGLSRVSAHPPFVALSKSAGLRSIRVARLLRLRERCHCQGPAVAEGGGPTDPRGWGVNICTYASKLGPHQHVPHAHTRAHSVRWLVPPVRASFSRKEVAPASGRVQSWVCLQRPSRRLPGRPQQPSRPPPGRGLRPRPEV